MGKLRALPPRLSKLPPRYGPATRSEQDRARHQERYAQQPWRAWYNTAEWKRLRTACFERDRYKCQQTGVFCVDPYPGPTSPVAHHIRAHKGDPVLFYDLDNLETVAKQWHDSVAQAMERGPKSAATRPSWLRPAYVPTTIVCGPPASGKTHYVNEHKQHGDIVIDLDQIVSKLFNVPMHGWDRDTCLGPALYMRNDMLGALSKEQRTRHAWFIVSAPTARERQWWQDTLRPVELVLLTPSTDDCMANAARDKDRNLDATYIAVREWWRDYTQDASERQP